MPEMNPAFVNWLEKTPEALARFTKIVEMWYKQSNEAPPQIPDDGPQEFRAGQTHQMRTVGISDEELTAMYDGFGQAIAKEKALAFVKGFVAGVIFG